MERAKPQAATKFLSRAGENVSCKSRKPAQLKAFSFKDYQLITKLINITGDGIGLVIRQVVTFLYLTSKSRYCFCSAYCANEGNSVTSPLAQKPQIQKSYDDDDDDRKPFKLGRMSDTQQS